MIKDQVPMAIGDSVIFHDADSKPYSALVTCIHTYTTINLVYVSSNEKEQDAYGRQIKRVTSVQHVSCVDVGGYYWRTEQDPINTLAEPLKR